MSGRQNPVRLKIYPVYGCVRGVYGITSSRSRCGACDAVVPDNVKFCPGCGVPIYGRVGEGSYIKCSLCGAYIPDGKHLDKGANQSVKKRSPQPAMARGSLTEM